MAQRPAELSQLIKAKALELGFAACGISKAEFLEEEAPRLEAWLKASAHGQMQYMENHFDKRLDPRKLIPGAESVISFTYNYYTDQKAQNPDAPRISMYAFGRDYHKVVKKKAEKLFDYIREIAGHIEGRIFVDSAPVMDKAWAKKSGLGWIGKHTNLIAKKTGSFFFIGEIIIDLPLHYDGPVTDHCGDCTKCMDACPTEAIIKPYVVDGSKCISYFTIELKEAIPVEMKGKFGNWVFGCDICQEVCPWNRFSIVNREKDFAPHEKLLSMQPEEWQAMTEETFDQVFRGTPVMRTKYKGLLRNLTFIADP